MYTQFISKYILIQKLMFVLAISFLPVPNDVIIEICNCFKTWNMEVPIRILDIHVVYSDHKQNTVCTTLVPLCLSSSLFCSSRKVRFTSSILHPNEVICFTTSTFALVSEKRIHV